jgi:hypothetical protein
MNADDSLPADVETSKSMLVAERAARMAAESEAQYRALVRWDLPLGQWRPLAC